MKTLQFEDVAFFDIDETLVMHIPRPFARQDYVRVVDPLWFITWERFLRQVS